MARLEVESWEQLMADELSAADMIEEVAVEDFGIEFEDWEELVFADARESERDRHRWELDPASAEDFLARNGAWKNGLASPWRRFGR